MINFRKTICMSLAAAMTVATASAKSAKRGVSENQFSVAPQLEVLEPGVSWYYNWGNVPGAGLDNGVIDFTGFEFVPMTWNANYNADKIRQYCASHPEVKYLLGFNEPNFTKQANMTPEQAAAEWPAVQSLARELGLKIVAPALNYSPNPPYTNPTDWMDEFVALVGEDAFDYVAIHNYGGFGVLKTLATTFHERYGKDVWVTEFCLWPNEGDPNSTVTPTEQINSMVESVEWLEQTPWIFRYAWFKPIGNSSASKGPNYGLLMPQQTSTESELSEQGKVYVYMTDFDADRYHSVGTTVAATEYSARYQANLGAGNNPGCPLPIEISAFNSGATLDYQFDVPSSEDYILTLTVSGTGEPVRFDPNLGVVSVNADGSDGEELLPATTFELPGSDDTYIRQRFTLSLQAGRQTIRLKDMGPYQPSGIRISTIRLDSAAGIGELAQDAAEAGMTVEYYNLQGVKVDAPEAGNVYIRRCGVKTEKILF